jgi:hypothetical protein
MILAAAMHSESIPPVEDAIERFCRGDIRTHSTVILPQYQFRLYRYLLRIVREPATAEDLFHVRMIWRSLYVVEPSSARN